MAIMGLLCRRRIALGCRQDGGPVCASSVDAEARASTEATLVQGASFVFDGKQTLLEHYDESSGAHVTIEELLEAALA